MKLFTLTLLIALVTLASADTQSLEPAPCNNDGTCDAGESTGSCENDCGVSTSTLVEGGVYVGYFPTWTDDAAVTDGADLRLSKVADYVTHVMISFVKPGLRYKRGSFNLAYTGLEFDDSVLADGTILREAIRLCHEKDQRVIIAVGGAVYNQWHELNIGDLVDLVRDLGADGIDLDWEPETASCSYESGEPVCLSDDTFTYYIDASRAAFPRPYLVTAPMWSTGAYGWGDYENSLPTSVYKGISYQPIKNSGDKLDLVAVMAYDAGTAFDPVEAYNAYDAIFSGILVLGVQPPPEGWGDRKLTIVETQSLTQHVLDNNGAGMMIWSLLKDSEDPDVTPQTVSEEICDKLTFPHITSVDCSQTLVGS